jgi:tetratricopeptide (TPR) repeat protein
MSPERYAIARLDEIERTKRPFMIPVRGHFGIQAFGCTAWSGGPGDELITDHHEQDSGHEELYVVVSGQATFTVDGEEVEGPAGTIVFAHDPATQRMAVATQEGTTVLAIGAKPGEAFRPLGWEWSSDAFPYFESGEPEKAYELLAEANEQHPDSPTVLYNLACAEALLGKKEEAVAHLRRAVELYEGYAEYARNDSDFDSIRDDPRFLVPA